MKRINKVLAIAQFVSNFYLIYLDYLGLISDTYLVRLRSGLRCYIRSGTNDKSRLQEIFFNEVYLRSDYEVKSGDMIFDIGANIGLFSLQLAFRNRNIKIYAFEPHRENYDLLKRNIEINSLDNIYPLNFGLGSKKGICKLYNSRNTGGHSMVEDREFHERNGLLEVYDEVDVEDISSFIEDRHIEWIDLLKIDIEGGEYDLLYSMSKEVISRIGCIIMEYHYIDEARNGKSMMEFLVDKGYKVINNYPHLEATKGT